MNRVCPICGGPVGPRETNKLFPFCSQRCQNVDLGRWLSEDYRIPGPPMDIDEDGEPDSADRNGQGDVS